MTDVAWVDQSPPDKFADAVVDGTRFAIVPDDVALPSLLVGIYSASGELIEVHSFVDPRTAFCIEHNTQRPITAPIFAKPLTPVAAARRQRASRSRKRRGK